MYDPLIMEEFDTNAFLRVIDPEDNQTGGGAASAIAGAMAASLVGMVARLSFGRKNMPESDDYYQAMDVEAQGLVNRLFAISNQDSSAFDEVMIAYRMPRSTEEEREARSKAIQNAIIKATEMPIENARCCVEVLELASKLRGRSNSNAASDLECAVYLATAGIKGAISNASINILSIKDETIAERYGAMVQELQEVVAMGGG
jgi:formiminotetrahydrofolate cyclodeaminase